MRVSSLVQERAVQQEPRMAKKHGKAKHKKRKAMATGGALAAAGLAASGMVSTILANPKVQKTIAKAVAAGIRGLFAAIGGVMRARRHDNPDAPEPEREHPHDNEPDHDRRNVLEGDLARA